MLEVAIEKEGTQDLMLHDMGDGLPFRPGTFDGVVSISAVQWLCNADKAHHVPRKRMRRFFRTLYACLTKGGRAALQVSSYPSSHSPMLPASLCGLLLFSSVQLSGTSLAYCWFVSEQS